MAVCPATGALDMSVKSGRRLPAWAMGAGLAVIFLGVVGYARWSGYWHTDVASDVYFNLVPRAAEFEHP